MNRPLKLSNERSSLAARSEEKKKIEQNFNNGVAQLENSQQLAHQFLEKGTQLHAFMRDKTLKSNKGPIAEQVEHTLLGQLIQMAERLNNDPTQKEGAGSVALETIVLKSLLILRDRLNELEYQQQQVRNAQPS